MIALAGGLMATTAAFAQTNRHNNLGAAEHLWKMKRISNTEFMAVGNGGAVLKYNTSCNDWIPVDVAGTGVDFRNISFPVALTGYISGPSNALYKTTDGGSSWAYISPSATGLTNASIQCVHFINADTGFIAGSQIGVSGGGRFIKRTTNGGNTWTDVTPATIATSTVYDMAFFAPGVGIAVATNNKAFRTTDNGLTWTAVTTPATAYSVAIADQNTAVAVANTAVMRTTDQGLTWTTVSTSASGIQGVHFYDGQNGMLTGANGAVLYTGDAGLNWTPIPTLLSQKVYDVVMTGPKTAVAVGANGVVFDLDKDQPFHRLFDERFCHPTDSVTYPKYFSNDLSGASNPRKWFFENVNENENGLEASGWFPGKFALYDAYYYEDVLNQHAKDSAFIETRTLDFSGTTALSLQWNEAFYTHPGFRSATRIDGFNGSSWVTLYTNRGLDFGDGVASAIFPTHKRNIDISALAGVTNARLRFYYLAPNTQDGLKNFWALSDIEVRTQTTDVATDSLTAVATNCLNQQPQDITLHFSNPGTLDVFPLQFGWSSSDGQSGSNAIYDVLPAGTSDQFTLIDDFIPQAAGTVTIKAWISNTPNHNYANDTVSLSLTYLPSATGAGILGADTSICPGSTLQLNALQGMSNIQWSNGSANTTLNVQQAGTYYVSGTLNTCPVSDTVNIALYNVTTPVLSETNGVLQVSPATYTQYEWYQDNVLMNAASHATLPVTVAGTYMVKVSTPDGCTTESSPFSYTPTGIREQINAASIRLYPVPVLQSLVIESVSQPLQQATVYVYDVLGKEVMKAGIPNNATIYNIDMQQFTAGIYMIKITGKQLMFTGRIVKQ